MKEPIDHIMRPRLPWRISDDGVITECGYDASKVKTLSRDDFFQREKDFGKQRTAMMTCMTCMDAARRWGRWDDDPRLDLQREIEWERGSGHWRARTDRGERLKGELIAISALVEAHRDEFDAIISTNIRQKEWLEKKAELAKKPKPSSQTSL